MVCDEFGPLPVELMTGWLTSRRWLSGAVDEAMVVLASVGTLFNFAATAAGIIGCC